MTLVDARAYLKKHRRYIKYTRVARDCLIDKNMISLFISGKTDLKPSQQIKLIRCIRTLQQ